MDDPMEDKGDKVSEIDLGALERDLMEYYFNETERGFILVENKPNNKHHKMCRQISKPPEQQAGD